MLKVYDIFGNELRTPVDEFQDAGEHIIKFNSYGIAPGVYFLRMEAGGKVMNRKMIIVK